MKWKILTALTLVLVMLNVVSVRAESVLFYPEQAWLSEPEYITKESGVLEDMFYNDNEDYWNWSQNTFGVAWVYPCTKPEHKEFHLYLNFSQEIENLTIEALFDSNDYVYFSFLNESTEEWEQQSPFFQGPDGYSSYPVTRLSGEWTNYSFYFLTGYRTMRISAYKHLSKGGKWGTTMYIDFCWAYRTNETTSTESITTTTEQATIDIEYVRLLKDVIAIPFNLLRRLIELFF